MSDTGHFLAFLGRRMEHLSARKKTRLQYLYHTALCAIENSDSDSDIEREEREDTDG